MTMRCVLMVAALSGCMVGPDEGYSDSEADADDPAQLDEVTALISGEADAPAASYAASTDRDGDGIPDATEEMLLRRYRPYYKFSKGDGGDEQYRPADPLAQLTNAQLRTIDPGGNGVSDPIAECGRASDHHLDPADGLYTCRTDTSFVAAGGKRDYCLNLDDSLRGGATFADASTHATGLYGHVAPTTIGGHDAYKIEYWQFFAFNNQDISVLGYGSLGDHEGDWTSVQLWFDRVLHRLVQVRYLIHGKAVTFTIPATTPTCRDCSIALRGKNYDPDPPEFFTNVAAYSDNQAEFYVDGSRFKHVVVYIEHGAHEFWPGAWGHASQSAGPVTLDLNPHHGDGTSYLVPDVKDRVLDVGEVDHPLTRAGRLILWFDGFWGCTNTKELAGFAGPTRRSPVGPALHCSWTWPGKTASIAGCEG